MAEALATSTISSGPDWTSVRRGLSVIFVASIVAYLLLVSFALATAFDARRALVDTLHYAVIVGGISFLGGLYLCATGPRKTSIPSQAGAALILGMLGMGVFYMFLGSSHITHSGTFGKHAAVPEPFAMFGLGSILIFAVSHLMTVWTLHSVTRAFRPGLSWRLPFTYVGIALCFLTLLGLYIVLMAMTDQVFWRLLERQWDGNWQRRAALQTTVVTWRNAGFWLVLFVSFPIQVAFAMLILRARRAVKIGERKPPSLTPPDTFPTGS